MVSCEVGGTMAGGIPESLVMGDGGGSEVTAEVKADFPCGTAGRQRSVWSQNVSSGLLTSHTVHSQITTTDCHHLSVCDSTEYTEVATL